jgi:hypothetical protein
VDADDPRLGDSLRPRRTDVVGLQGLEQRPAQEPREIGHRHEAEGERGQHLSPPAVRPARGREEARLLRDVVDEERRDEEARQGDPEPGEDARRVVEGRSGPQRGRDSDRDPEEERPSERERTSSKERGAISLMMSVTRMYLNERDGPKSRVTTPFR